MKELKGNAVCRDDRPFSLRKIYQAESSYHCDKKATLAFLRYFKQIHYYFRHFLDSGESCLLLLL
jgi:hypothetical protein